MNNPFSNRVCIDAGDYILKKKRLTKIANLKQSQYANYKTSTYIVCSGDCKKNGVESIEKRPYPAEPCFLPNPMLSYHPVEIHNLKLEQYGEFNCSSQAFDHYDKLSYEAPSYNEYKNGVPSSTKSDDEEKYTNIFNPKCKKCSNDLACMGESPDEWFCDGWDPPFSHCVGGNNIKLDKQTKAYCCPNVKHCNWMICEPCYISLGKKNKTLYRNPPPPEPDAMEYEPDHLAIKKQIEIEGELMLKKHVENMRKGAPFLKCISSYSEYLDLAKGFHLTEPFCESEYDDCGGLNPNNGRLIQNISEGRFSAIDMGNESLYVKRDYQYPNEERCSLYKDVVVDKCRKDKGLLNLRGIVTPKIKTERKFKFPLTLKKTHFCCNDVEKISRDPKIHDYNNKHVHWFPTRNAFIKYSHDKGNHGVLHQYKNPQLQADISEEGKRRVLDFTGPHYKDGFSPCDNCQGKKQSADHIFKYKIR